MSLKIQLCSVHSDSGYDKDARDHFNMKRKDTHLYFAKSVPDKRAELIDLGWDSGDWLTLMKTLPTGTDSEEQRSAARPTL